ncbi:hypothetical protein BGX38DRAFT_1262450, partial [Terfezia claveryi]
PPFSAKTIVGAGVAGLRAAEVLLNANKENGDANVEYHVTVFEAQGRIGGRVVTSDGINGWSGVGKAVDLGPNWIHGIYVREPSSHSLLEEV